MANTLHTNQSSCLMSPSKVCLVPLHVQLSWRQRMVKLAKEAETPLRIWGIPVSLKRASWMEDDEHLQKEKAGKLQGSHLHLKKKKLVNPSMGS